MEILRIRDRIQADVRRKFKSVRDFLLTFAGGDGDRCGVRACTLVCTVCTLICMRVWCLHVAKHGSVFANCTVHACPCASHGMYRGRSESIVSRYLHIVRWPECWA